MWVAVRWSVTRSNRADISQWRVRRCSGSTSATMLATQDFQWRRRYKRKPPKDLPVGLSETYSEPRDQARPLPPLPATSRGRPALADRTNLQGRGLRRAQSEPRSQTQGEAWKLAWSEQLLKLLNYFP